MKKFFSVLLILLILVFSVDQNRQEAQAVAGVDDVVILSYIAAAAIAAGAVGTVALNTDGTYSGTLHNLANTSLLNMTPEMKLNLSMALMGARAVGYMAIDKVTGLWDYLHSQFTQSGSIVPSTMDLNQEGIYFAPNAMLQIYPMSSDHLKIRVANQYGGNTCTWYIEHTSGTWKIYNGGVWYSYAYTITLEQLTAMTNFFAPIIDANLTNIYKTSTFTTWWNAPSSYTGTFPNQETTSGIGNVIDDGTPERDIAIPQNYPDLNNRTKDIAYPTTNTGGISLPANPTADQMKTADTASDLTYAPSTTSDWADTIAKGITGALGLEGLLSPTAPTTIDWSPIQHSVDLFTNKFPFSLPWDLYHMVQSFGSGSTTAPVFRIGAHSSLMDFEKDVTFDQFDSFMPSVRIFELITFNVGLLFATRKLLGGAT